MAQRCRSQVVLPRNVVLGAGAMGGLFGALLARSGLPVVLVDSRRDHVELLRHSGLVLDDGSRVDVVRGFDATSDMAGVSGADVVFVFVKAGDSESALEEAAPFLAPHATVVTLQNGLGNAERISSFVPPERVVAGTTGVGASNAAPGRIAVAGIAETVLGPLAGYDAARAERVACVLSSAGLPVRVSNAITGVIWTKLLANVGINAIAALTCLRNGEIFASPDGSALAASAVREAALVAAAEGVRLEVDDPVAHVRDVAERTWSNRASMLQDVLAERLTEIEAINGEIVRRGARLGIPVPVNEALLRLVRLRQRAYGTS